MNSDLATLLIGASIGILGTASGYYLQYLLKIKEQHMAREYRVREKGRDFFHRIYGMVSILSGYAASFLADGSDRIMILTDTGYSFQSGTDVIKTYKEAYEKQSRIWFSSVESGLEVFITEALSKQLATFWAYAQYLYENNDWNMQTQNLRDMEEVSHRICHTIDELLGLAEKRSSRPKLLSLKYLRLVIRGEMK